jgi:hypothetical protein
MSKRLVKKQTLSPSLAHHCVPVVDGKVHGYRLRHSLGANAMMDHMMPADFVGLLL